VIGCEFTNHLPAYTNLDARWSQEKTRFWKKRNRCPDSWHIALFLESSGKLKRSLGVQPSLELLSDFLIPGERDGFGLLYPSVSSLTFPPAGHRALECHTFRGGSAIVSPVCGFLLYADAFLSLQISESDDENVFAILQGLLNQLEKGVDDRADSDLMKMFQVKVLLRFGLTYGLASPDNIRRIQKTP